MLKYLETLTQSNKLCKINLEALEEVKTKKLKELNLKHNKDLLNILDDGDLPFQVESMNLRGHSIQIGERSEIDDEDFEKLKKYLKDLIPWRKGPFDFFGEHVDSEWRSDWKWQRVEQHVQLENKTVLDIGCNNGYFMFKMAAHNPKMVLGIDPVLRNLSQFQLVQNFLKLKNLHFELFGIEHLNYFKNTFDTIFSMGILYHHRSPLDQLMSIRESLKPGGELVLETLIIPGDELHALCPPERYAKMRNVYFLPTNKCLISWLEKCKFENIQLIHSEATSLEEQRNTDYCPRPQETLKDFLDPNDSTKTIEGYPAPRRSVIIAKKKG
ncbi:MAG: tRNA 5-methoxyuridine(34)/uridine 5-oxyacetic acid(34) synthase CmoB [Bacteriovoracaceae bacterium]